MEGGKGQMDEMASNETDDEESVIAALNQKPVIMSYGFLSKVKYEHKSKNCKIQSVTYNSKTCEYVIVDSRGISAWSNSFKVDKTARLLEFPAYQFNVIKILLYCRPFNLYFALTREYQLKIYNLNFHETFSIDSDTNALIHMIFNAQTNELITASRSEIQIWKFGEINRQNDSSKASYGLLLERKWTIDHGRLLNRINLDNECQRLYCLSESDIWCYDLTGRFVFFIRKACSTHLSACVYANEVHSVVAGSIDGQISILTKSGGKIHSFLSHSSLVTELMIHPSDGHLVISSSLDGYIKILSLDLLEELYSLKVFNEGIEYMSLRSSNLIFCVSTKEIEIFDLNYFCQFWGQLQYPAETIELVRNTSKSNRLMVVDSDSSMKLFSEKDGRKLCTVLPPPTVGQGNKILSCVHDRDYNLVYFLVSPSEIWVYTTKTDPACFLAPIDVWEEPQYGKTSRGAANTPSEALTTPNPPSEDQKLAMKINCNCIEVFHDFFDVEFYGDEGQLHAKCNFLACGMENGDILLFNPLLSGRKEKTISLFKDPVIGLKYTRKPSSCLVMTKGTESLILKMINSNLEILLSVFCENDITCHALKGKTLAAGFSSGHVLVHQLHERKPFVLSKPYSVDHLQGVLSVSFHPAKNILCSSGKDSCVKVWSLEKNLLCEINVNASLTTACFLNSRGEILMGFQGHIFIIRNQRQLDWLSCQEADDEDKSSSESEIYESPHIKYELKRPPSPVSDNMENYLVPYQDMMFSTIGTWVVEKDSDLLMSSDKESNLTKDRESDDESLAPTEIYQSSLYSASSQGSRLWRLPACGDSPDMSMTESDEDAPEEEIVEVVDAEKVKESKVKPVDSKSRLEELLAKTEQKPKGKKFAHGASEKLKNAKIDSQKLKSKQRQKPRDGLKNTPANDQVNIEQIQEKDVPQKGRKRQVVKKAKKVTESSRRVLPKKTMDAQTFEHGSMVEVQGSIEPKELEKDEHELVDGGYSSPVLNNEYQEPGEDDRLPDEYGVSLVKNQVRLATSARSVGSVYKERTDKIEIGPKTEFPSEHIQRGEDVSQEDKPEDVVAGNVDLHGQEQGGRGQFEKVPQDHDATEDVDMHERPRISSAQFDSQCSSPISMQTYGNLESPIQRDGTFSNSSFRIEDSFIDSPLQPDVLETPTFNLSGGFEYPEKADTPSGPEEEATRGKIRNAKPSSGYTKYTINARTVSTKLSSATAHTSHRTRKSKTEPKRRSPHNAGKVRVVPAYQPRDLVQSDVKSVKVVHNPLEMRSERVNLRQSSERNQRPAVLSATRKADRKHEEVPVLRRRSSQAVRVPVGDFVGTERFLSSASIELRRSSPVDQAMRQEESTTEPTGDLLKFCLSALKKKNTSTRRASSSIRAHSAGINLTDATKDSFFDQMRPNTAPYDQQSFAGVTDDTSGDFDHAQIETVNQTNLASNLTEGYFTEDTPFSPHHGNEKKATDLLENQAASYEEEEFNFKVIISRGDGYRELKKQGGNRELRPGDLSMFGSRLEKKKLDVESAGKDFLIERSNSFEYIRAGRERASYDYHQDSTDHRAARNQTHMPISIYKKARSTLLKKSEEKIPIFHDTADVTIIQKDDEHVSRDSTDVWLARERSVSFYEDGNSVHAYEDYQRMSGSPDYNGRASNASSAVGPSTMRHRESAKHQKARDVDDDASKRGLIFVSLPTSSDARNYASKDDGKSVLHILNSSDKLRKTEMPTGPQAARVAGPQDKLLERRAISARLRRRHDSAKFRRDAIERQRRARTGNRSASPTYSPEYAGEFLADDEQELKAACVYEYNKPQPLPEKHKKKNTMAEQNKGLKARLSGQPFRYGKLVPNDENEAVIVDFIRSSLNKTGERVNLLPRPKSMPSIPAKCHQYVLVTETAKQEQKPSKREEELLHKRFSEFSLQVS